MKSVYENPEYYEIAFSFRDIEAEVDTLERCCRDHARLQVKDILEIGCGPSPHLEELLKRGYVYTGLDINQVMLDYSAQKARNLEGNASFILADMIDFTPSKTCDLAFIALGSLCARDTADIFSHFRSVASALNEGGLYFLDWCIHFAPFSAQEDSWTIEQENIKVTTHYSEKPVNVVHQLMEETIHLEVLEGETTSSLRETSIKRVIFPQEFLQIINQIRELEFVGWWNNWDLDKPLDSIKDPAKISRPITLLRRK